MNCPPIGKRLVGMFILNSQDPLGSQISGIISEQYITVVGATQLTGYNSQYLRRLLRNGKLAGIRIGQIWLILLESLETYVNSMNAATDLRCGPQCDPFSATSHSGEGSGNHKESTCLQM